MDLRDSVLSEAGEFTDLANRVYDAWLKAPSDKEILGKAIQPGDEDSDTLQGKVSYAWYWAFGQVIKPKVHAEIGVRYGYSTYAVAGGEPGLLQPFQAFGWDLQNYGVDSSPIARKLGCFVELRDADSQKFTTLNMNDTFDTFSVDGDHSEEGAYHDLELAFDATKHGGWILVDDVRGLYYPSHPPVTRAVARFMHDRNQTGFFLPTFRGLTCIQVNKFAKPRPKLGPPSRATVFMRRLKKNVPQIIFPYLRHPG
jgi:hypothetical protein